MCQSWEKIIAVLDFAFQPIVSAYTGTCVGFEALLRGHKEAGFSSIHEVFESAWKDQYLYHLEFQLREKAIQKFCHIPGSQQLKLFFNIDTRVVNMPDYQPGRTLQILAKYNLQPHQLVLEVSEQHQVSSLDHLQRVLNQYRQQGFQVALDDYGIGFSGLQLLYYCEPEYIKIPRFFIEGLARDHRKKLFLSNLVNISHVLGIQTIAEGIETAEEFHEGRGIGFDLVQGFLIQQPTLEIENLQERYPLVLSLNQMNRRRKREDVSLILAHCTKMPFISDQNTLIQVCEAFRENPQHHLLPVVDQNNTPLGVIKEQELRKILYSRYGHALLENPTLAKLEQFLIPCPVLELSASCELLISAFAVQEMVPGILLTQEGRYAGFLSPQALLKLIYEKKLYEAQDQNPLTNLPGNQKIYEYLLFSLQEKEATRIYLYFDIDHFKSFNDHYGFRQGDRVILLLSSLLQEIFWGELFFIGHIGGDDFFVGTSFDQEENTPNAVIQHMQQVLLRFSRDVTAFYDETARLRGYIEEYDREGKKRRFPLLSITAITVILPPERTLPSAEFLSQVVAKLKKHAKDNGIACVIYLNDAAEKQNHTSMLQIPYNRSTSRINSVNLAGEGNDLSDVVDPTDPGHSPLNPQAKTGVGTGSVAAQV